MPDIKEQSAGGKLISEREEKPLRMFYPSITFLGVTKEAQVRARTEEEAIDFLLEMFRKAISFPKPVQNELPTLDFIVRAYVSQNKLDPAKVDADAVAKLFKASVKDVRVILKTIKPVAGKPGFQPGDDTTGVPMPKGEPGTPEDPKQKTLRERAEKLEAEGRERIRKWAKGEK